MPTPKHHESSTIRMRFVAELCDECGQVIFPPRDLCPECREEVLPALRRPDYKDGGDKPTSLGERIATGNTPEHVIVFRPGGEKECG